MASTKFVPPWACWCAYLSSLTAMAAAFLHTPDPPSFLLSTDLSPDDSMLWTGFVAHTAATCVLFVWSFMYSNTSIYDPAWCYYPVALPTVHVGVVVCDYTTHTNVLLIHYPGTPWK